MSTVECVPSVAVVIESLRLPTARHVAGVTRRWLSSADKLPLMGILMALGAARTETGQLHSNGPASSLDSGMALDAGEIMVLSLESKGRRSMIEADFRPRRDSVTSNAAFVAHIAIELAAVRITVAGAAGMGREAKAGQGNRPPHRSSVSSLSQSRAVATIAGYSEVGTLQGIATLLVLCHSVERGTKALEVVAGRAPPVIRPVRECPVMGIPMTIRAAPEPRQTKLRGAPMAAFALDRPVHSAKRIARSVMVEPHLPHLLPSARRVTGIAGGAQPSSVRVPVAVAAPGERHPLERDRFRLAPVGTKGAMALLAAHLPMKTGQRIAGIAVIKSLGRLP